eukprot:3818824-Rhodomonas_salina.1
MERAVVVELWKPDPLKYPTFNRPVIPPHSLAQSPLCHRPVKPPCTLSQSPHPVTPPLLFPPVFASPHSAAPRLHRLAFLLLALRFPDPLDPSPRPLPSTPIRVSCPTPLITQPPASPHMSVSPRLCALVLGIFSTDLTWCFLLVQILPRHHTTPPPPHQHGQCMRMPLHCSCTFA